jgi:hypothetical protein
MYRESFLALVRFLYLLYPLLALACCRATSPEGRGPTEVSWNWEKEKGSGVIV